MNILVVGSGGREHAFAWKISQSKKCSKLYIAPGNAGTSQIAENVNIAVTDFKALGEFCISHNINLMLVGPEAPLVEGISDYFSEQEELRNVLVVGPNAEGAQLEGSKDFSKGFMSKYGIPTAASKTFTTETIEEGLKYVASHDLPVVLKADGLAAGKGVIIAETHEYAIQTLKDMLLDKKFGDASAKVVIEQFLDGIELSVFVLTDGTDYVILPEAKDYKRIGEGDTGPNTGGMGAISPVPFADKAFMDKVEQRIIQPTMKGLNKENIKYVGFIFFGLIKVNNEPWVIEYNARMGDPETEVVLPRIKSDIVDLLEAAASGNLKSKTIEFHSEHATTIMLVAGGYPDSYEKGDIISGLDKILDVVPFHAGTSMKDGHVVTNGGRVLALTGLGNDQATALAKSNAAAKIIDWKGRYYRSDIGFDLV
jgi:phosphoribosylamine--glycine ligase